MVDQDHITGRAEWRRGWAVVVAATASMSLASLSSNSIGVMMMPIERELNWSRMETASGLSIVAFCNVTLLSLMGLLIDRIGPRRSAIIAVVMLCSALMLMSTTASSVWSWWSLWLLVGLASALMPTVWTATVSGHFSASRGLALAVMLSGTRVSPSLVPVTANYFVEQFGWRSAYLALGRGWGLVVLPLVLLFFRGTSERQRPTPHDGTACTGSQPARPLLHS
jgi:MFS family permease